MIRRHHRRCDAQFNRGTAQSVVAEITESIGRLEEGQKRLESGLTDTNSRIDAIGQRLDRRIDGLGERLDQRIESLGDRLDQRIDGLGARLDKRIDELTAQQGRMVETVAALGGEVAGLKRDQHSADVLERRVARIEDRLFAQPG